MKSSTRFKHNLKGQKCKNCDNILNGNENFCSKCGQVNDERPLSLMHFFSEFFIGFFSFDTRFFNTLFPLLFKPGKVSKDYISGKRKKYTNPFQLYLHISIVFFLVIGLISTYDKYSNMAEVEQTNKATIDSLQANETLKLEEFDESSKELIENKLDSVFQYTDLIDQLKNNNGSKTHKDSIYNELLKIGLKAAMSDSIFNNFIKSDRDIMSNSEYEIHTKNVIDNLISKNNLSFNSEIMKISSLPDTIGIFHFAKWNNFVKYAKTNNENTSDEALVALNYPLTKANKYWYERAQDYLRIQSDKTFRNEYMKTIISKISIALFFLLPFLTLFFSIFYIRSRYRYTEHLIVVFYLQTVFFILLLIGLVLNLILKSDLFLFISIVLFFIYFYKTLRRFYEQGRFKTIIKFLMLNLVYFLLSILGLIIIASLTFLVK